MKSIYFTAKAYIGGLLKSGYMAVHTTTNEIYFGVTDKKTVELLHSGKDTGWIAPPLENSWEVYDEAIAYRKDAVGVLHFKGTARYGTINYAMFQLPTEYRPTRNISLVVAMDSTYAVVDINTNGYVTPRLSSEPAYISLEMSFIL